MHMTVQSKHRLPLLDKPLDRNAADVDIQRNVLVGLPIQRRAVERCITRWRMEKKHRAIERIFARKGSEVFLDRSPFDLALFRWHTPIALLRRDTARRDVPGNIVTLPVLQQERRRRNIGKAVDRKSSKEKFLLVGVVPEAICCGRDKPLLFAAWVVVAEDEENVGIVHA